MLPKVEVLCQLCQGFGCRGCDCVCDRVVDFVTEFVTEWFFMFVNEFVTVVAFVSVYVMNSL